MTLQELKERGGVTLHYGEEAVYDSGYQVAIDSAHGGQETCIPADSEEQYNQLFDSIKEFPSCGIWFDKDNNEIVVDELTIHISDKITAILLAQENNQDSIFDWETKEVITKQEMYTMLQFLEEE